MSGYAAKQITRHPLFKPYVGMPILCEDMDGEWAGNGAGWIFDIQPEHYIVFFGMDSKEVPITRKVKKSHIQMMYWIEGFGRNFQAIQTLFNNTINEVSQKGYEIDLTIETNERNRQVHLLLKSPGVTRPFIKQTEYAGSKNTMSNDLVGAYMTLYLALLNFLHANYILKPTGE